MKCNLTKLVRCIVVVVIAVVSINMVIFLKSHQGQASGAYEDVFPHGPRHVQDKRAYPTKASTTETPVRLNSTVRCPGLEMIKPHQVGEFQMIRGNGMYVYSAHLDYDTVRIIAVVDNDEVAVALTCQMWFLVKSHDSLFVTSASIEILPEDHGRRYTAAFIVCHLPAHLRNATLHAVSLVAGKACDVPINILTVPRRASMTTQFTVCVTPFNYRYSRAYELVEMIEMNKILGAQKFVFYNHSTGPNVDKVLEMYQNSGEVEVHPWHLPMKTDTWPPTGEPDVHYFAQIAALNDCLYRNKNRSKYLVYQDLDEFIIPHKHSSWEDLLEERTKQPGDKSCFLFKCVFFRKEWPSPATLFQSSAEEYKSVILTYSFREGSYLPWGMRSKYIVNPVLTDYVGVHQAGGGSETVDSVPESVAGLHHYRSWERPDDAIPRVKDEFAAIKYGVKLIERLKNAWSKLNGVAMDINITTYGRYV